MRNWAEPRQNKVCSRILPSGRDGRHRQARPGAVNPRNRAKGARTVSTSSGSSRDCSRGHPSREIMDLNPATAAAGRPFPEAEFPASLSHQREQTTLRLRHNRTSCGASPSGWRKGYLLRKEAGG